MTLDLKKKLSFALIGCMSLMPIWISWAQLAHDRTYNQSTKYRLASSRETMWWSTFTHVNASLTKKNSWRFKVMKLSKLRNAFICIAVLKAISVVAMYVNLNHYTESWRQVCSSRCWLLRWPNETMSKEWEEVWWSCSCLIHHDWKDLLTPGSNCVHEILLKMCTRELWNLAQHDTYKWHRGRNHERHK